MADFSTEYTFISSSTRSVSTVEDLVSQLREQENSYGVRTNDLILSNYENVNLSNFLEAPWFKLYRLSTASRNLGKYSEVPFTLKFYSISGDEISVQNSGAIVIVSEKPDGTSEFDIFVSFTQVSGLNRIEFVPTTCRIWCPVWWSMPNVARVGPCTIPTVFELGMSQNENPRLVFGTNFPTSAASIHLRISGFPRGDQLTIEKMQTGTADQQAQNNYYNPGMAFPVPEPSP